MDVLIHQISDLHFGRERPALVERYLEAVQQEQPELIVITGDFVQRGSRSEWARAERFLARLAEVYAGPVSTIPGNHDISALSLFKRLVKPFEDYREVTRQNTEFTWHNQALFLCGLNSARRFGQGGLDWSLGALSDAQIMRAVEAAKPHAGKRTCWLAVHHPPWQSLTDAGLKACRLPEGALERLEEAGYRAILSGHTHKAGRSDCSGMINISAATAFSDRTRVQPNSFNRIGLAQDGELSVEIVTLSV